MGGRRLWTRPGVLAWAVVVVLIYGSLIPFDIAWSQTVEQEGGPFAAMIHALGSPSWVSAAQGESSMGLSFAMSDLLMNLVLYLPLGVTLRMALRARWKRWPIEIAGTAGIAFALSWGVESLQGLMITRVASLNDVLMNTVAASVAACFAPLLWGGYKRASFACYCRLVVLADRLRSFGRRPGVVMIIAIVNAIVIGLWFLGEVRRSFAVEGSTVALPFEKAFALPYDIGAVLLGQSMLAYAGIGCLLLLLTYTGARRIAMNWVVLGVVTLAFAAELTRAGTQGAAPDITGPLLALSAGAIMTVTLYTFTFAVKRSNRRHQEATYQGEDRRRRPHKYT